MLQELNYVDRFDLGLRISGESIFYFDIGDSLLENILLKLVEQNFQFIKVNYTMTKMKPVDFMACLEKRFLAISTTSYIS